MKALFLLLTMAGVACSATIEDFIEKGPIWFELNSNPIIRTQSNELVVWNTSNGVVELNRILTSINSCSGVYWIDGERKALEKEGDYVFFFDNSEDSLMWFIENNKLRTLVFKEKNLIR